MNALAWIGLGVIAGFVINFRKHVRTDILAESSILGILGGVIAGFLVSFYVSTSFLETNLTTFVASFIGALLFSSIGKQFARE